MAVFATGRHAAGVTLQICSLRCFRAVFFGSALFEHQRDVTRFDDAPYSYCVDPGMG